MKLARTVNLGGYQSQKFESSEHDTVKDCARDLIAQMQPMGSMYPTVRGVIAELQRAYGV